MRALWAKRLAWALAGVLLLAAMLFSASLWFARIETNQHGVHKRLLLPISASGYLAFPSLTGHGDQVRIPGFLDGPVVRRGAGQQYSASWFCEDRVVTRQGEGPELTVDCAGRRHRFLLGQLPAATAEVAHMPANVLALSDIEGNLAYLDAALARLAIVDADGNWQFGRGSLVIVGDSVDRGRDVFAVLWRLYNLSQQAQAAGGSVHTLLGNHEQYVLLGRVKSVHPDHAHGARQLGGIKAAFASDTVLGAWLRRQPVLVKLGPVMFAHGGISPELAAQKLSIAQINAAMAAYWRAEAAPEAGLDAAIGLAGVTQYRGYVPETGPGLSSAQLDAVLAQYGASSIVVGHTIVKNVTGLFGGRVYAIDVNDDDSAAEVLMFENGRARVVDIGVPRRLQGDDRSRIRPIRLSEGADWHALRVLVAGLADASKVPHPY